MKSFKTSLTICMQNLRKWTGDYRVLIVFTILLIVNNYCASWFLNFSNNMGSQVGVAPWIYVFIFTGFGFDKIMLFAPLLLLFSNAPFIDDNQPYIISRCTRKSWCFGQIIYIIIAGAIYVLVSALMSVVMLIGNLDLTLDWGNVISTAGNSPELQGAGATGVSTDVLYYFSPLTAMFYTMLLAWFACIFIGLLIYVINSVSNKTGYGIFAGGFFVLFDFVQEIISSGFKRYEWISYLSPVSWCSIDLIDITGQRMTPNITFVLCGYAVLIIGLSVVAVLISRKQQIDVIQAV